jgi:ferredoxin-type protein NapG
MTERRSFLINTLKGLGLAMAGGVFWSSYIHNAKAAPLVLRPPGAIPERLFLAKCTKCGICVEECPYKALLLGKPGDNIPVGTPYFIPRMTPCYMCQDIPCMEGCPTGALDKSLVSDGNGKDSLNINLARIGLAVIDRETCIAYWGMQCDVCYRACPLIDKAITVEYTRNERTGRHAFLAPVVNSEYCTGCGLCEHACITEKASVFVLPSELVQGKSTAKYLRDWVEEDEKKLEDVFRDTPTVTPRSKKTPEDYLNQDIF